MDGRLLQRPEIRGEGRFWWHHLYLERSHELIHHNCNPAHTTYIPHKYISRAKWAMYPAQLVYLYPAQNHFPHQIGNVSRAISLYPAQSVYIPSLVYLFISRPKSCPAHQFIPPKIGHIQHNINGRESLAKYLNTVNMAVKCKKTLDFPHLNFSSIGPP